MLEPMTDEAVQAIVSQAIDDADDFIESDIAPDRIKAQRYMAGECDVDPEPGRSELVATKCRDTVRAVRPSLLRVFLQTDKPVEFIPRGDDDVAAAEQATEYVNWKFQQSNGYRVLYNAFHDALVKKAGIVKVTYKERSETEVIPFDGLSLTPGVMGEPAEFDAAAEDFDVLEYADDGATAWGKFTREVTRGDIVVESIPPEEFLVDSNATSLDDFYIVAHRTDGRIADLIDMGFAYEDLEGLDDETGDEEEYERDGYTDDEDILDPSMKAVTITEAYMRVDVEGTGNPQLYAFICAGQNNKILRKDPVDDTPFAVFEADPEPHRFFGNALVDLILQDQDAATVFLRGMADNVTATNNPGTAYDSNVVNPIDITNDEFGRKWRVNGPPAPAIMEMQVPFIAAAVLPFLEYYDRTVEERSGVNRASLGLNPDALRNSTATAVDAAVAGAEGQTEVIARNLAEGGMRRLFKLMLRLVKEHPDPQAMMRISGATVLVDPSSWDAEMDLAVNVGLGTRQVAEKTMALRETLAAQQQIFAMGGNGNGLVTLTNIRNTLADLQAMGGIRNHDRYFQPMDPQREEMLIAQAAQQQQPPQPDPTYVAGEQIKAQAKVQGDQMRAQVDIAKERMKDDRERDKAETDALLRAAELLGQHGVQVNQQQIDAMRERDRF